ncbi:MAG: EFR1 family ferrodoxin [Clostridiaceae bacterium]
MTAKPKCTIYYFSGTGNSLRAAQVIAKALGNTEIVSMRCNPAEVPAMDSDIIGFVFPIYHWTLHEAAKEFVEHVRINPNAYIFAVSTLCRINGDAFEVLDQLLQQKGARLHYGKRVFSVANLCIVYTPFPSEKRRVPATERALEKTADELNKRVERPYSKAGLLTRLIYPKMMPKYRAVQADLDYGFFTSDACVSCGVCARVCPKKNIELADGRPVFLHHCSCCMACIAYCPNKAIQYRYPPEQRAELDTLFTRMMKLPENRKRYHHPLVSAADMMADKMRFE